MDKNKGRVTLPTDVDVIQETLELSLSLIHISQLQPDDL